MFEQAFRNMGNAGRNGGEYYTPRPLIRVIAPRITPLLRLKYHDSIADAVADLGRPDAIGETFAGFQRHLYEEPVAG